MTNEDMQRKMDFIVEQQAWFAAHIQQLEEERIRDQPRIARLEKSYERLEESFLRLVALAEITDSRLDRLELSTSSLEINMAAHEETLHRLDRLIEVSERRLNESERRLRRLEFRDNRNH